MIIKKKSHDLLQPCTLRYWSTRTPKNNKPLTRETVSLRKTLNNLAINSWVISAIVNFSRLGCKSRQIVLRERPTLERGYGNVLVCARAARIVTSRLSEFNFDTVSRIEL
ncbi:hypothetical protein O3G_MSEX004581 [Manduca sexta]|uniref:Uncharacterized protein n=1 Tax=Manduca sexta TaxID=7130 RepID=A0A921YWV1_MANSE|nr:hypothetical protein O3G_MSEX004581 [Manduca sexta]